MLNKKTDKNFAKVILFREIFFEHPWNLQGLFLQIRNWKCGITIPSKWNRIATSLSALHHHGVAKGCKWREGGGFKKAAPFPPAWCNNL